MGLWAYTGTSYGETVRVCTVDMRHGDPDWFHFCN